ncbi:MAG: pyridoxal phosphate-dependent aminotransferase family protein [Candidatus Kapaibacterium sp.]|nr:pyridoxal phosphate-dependent aminotransferase family protein [Ignavibacteriota bacterium]
MDLFEKAYHFHVADEAKEKGIYPYFRAVEENEGPVVSMEGRKVIMAGSNNYLGLTAHPEVREAAIKAIEKYGTGCSGSRYLTGTLDLHIELEHRLAKYLGFEEVLLFSTGYQTGIGTISALPTKGEYIVMDKENHACLINGAMMAKGAFVELVRYKHNDMNDLERVLSNLPLDAGKLLVTDGVFSVTGELVKLPELLDLAKKYNARVLVDDAHATGVVGVGGRGTASHYGLVEETDMIMGTFSKTFASLGGFVAGPSKVIDFVKHTSPALIFSASPTPSSCAATLAALNILEREPERVSKLKENADYMRAGFHSLGFEVIDSLTAIVPVIVGDVEKALMMWRRLYDAGVFVNAFIPPGVPPTMSMMRTSYMATHEKQHLDKILEVFGEVGKEFGLIK